ncbi:uncharacterized protein LOC117780990 [Drosophila innubila]|uniref:uncharacterized protein LOC117780990 n=1 Tax=Drosophila innubila TaxID=198719 RepID=UPI00148BF301|nr:uncharacterized protein LOC117780990 [Drosophila innubila]
MLNKTLIFSVLFAFICVQYATSLSCYTCENAINCKNATKTTCTNAIATVTSNHLGVYNDNVTHLNSLRFDCLALKYTYPNNNSISYQLHGCVHPDLHACNLALKHKYSSWKKTCKLCSGDNCNKNPAGKMSSSVFTIVATVLGLVLAKIYA